MQQIGPPLVDLADVRQAVGTATYTRGSAYARQRAVLSIAVERHAVHGLVQGSEAQPYAVVAHLRPGRRGGQAVLDYGECSCPVEFDCKHVVALLIAANGVGRPAKRKPDWAESLDALLREPAATTGGTTPLAIELSVDQARLRARLVRPARKHGGWIVGDLSWPALDQPHYLTDYLPRQLAAVRELYTAYRIAGTDFLGYYSSANARHLDLTACESRQLWPLLDEATRAGVRLVHARKGLGDLPPVVAGELTVDITGGTEGALVLTPSIETDAAETKPVAFIGSDGHGAVCIDPAQATADPATWRLRLVRLPGGTSAQLQQLTLRAGKLEVPASGRDRFATEFFPRLRRTAAVVSSDSAFTPPAISGPVLRLSARYSDGHVVDLTWQWRYTVGDSTVLSPIAGDEPHRDPAAEQEVLRRLHEETGEQATDRTLTGLDTLRFSTEVLPLLTDVELDITRAPDYREVGDSLTVAVSTDEIAGERDWFDLGVTVSVEGREVPFTDLFTALAKDQSHLLLPDGAYFALDKPELRALRTLIEEARAITDTSSGTPRISRYQLGLWEELAALGVVDRQADAWQRQVEALKSLDNLDSVTDPRVDATLRPYQKDGVAWLTLLWRLGLGGILADDMGLGKTLQTLALISHAHESDSRPFLIVAPASVVANWAAEAERFTPHLRVATVTRSGRTLPEADVVVTSYTLLRLDFDAYAAADWAALVLDEAQFAKNHRSKVYQCARRLPAPFKLAITGTPLENNLMELWSMLSITAPGLFPDPAKFKEYYARPIERGGDAELLARLRRRIKPLLKRRTKEQVAAELPAKQEQVLSVRLHPKHRTIYERRLHRERQRVLGMLDDLDRNRFTILRSLTVLRRLALHAGLVDDEHDQVACAKLDALVEQLDDVRAGGHRALVFSQFTGFLDRVRTRLDDAGIEYCYLDGKTRNRAEVIDGFKNGSAPVFLISLKAGGFGLNLTEADYCFLLDPWWNPATENQAVDRTHRIGQTRNVMVYRLISEDTIEEKVMALKARKAELFTSVLDDGDSFSTALDADDIRSLFS
ncbi:DEAD/DEAH box helicase [Amycolatopsis suaedae]|uniref:Helicase n=1 Tax=Amycolatopsis suaedae TaxID=2510978 RepID=A0A4Q7J8R3_9PSEU|nr:DEAD/DEAH box helicase [Amycolatopsis suaedae]RZQ63378.1 helicase [Amycolatopsis suaedae]